MHMTNLVTLIADEITETARYPQPELSLAAAISAVGSVMGHVYCTETDLRTNMYVFSVSESGTGKDHPRQYIQKLFKEAGIAKRVRNKAASGPGLVGALHRAGGVLLLQTDEMGKELELLMDKRANSYMREIPTLMTELFSTANGFYYDKDLSNRDGKNEPRDIDQPCLCINGSTVPGPLYESMSSASVLDGFLSRFLIFEGDPEVDPIKERGKYEVDPDFVSAIQKIIHIMGDVSKNQFGEMDFSQVVIKPTIVSMDAQARSLFDDFEDDMQERKKNEIRNQTGLAGVWARAAEHVSKLSLVGHSVGSGVIDLATVEWAIDIVGPRIWKTLEIAKNHISDNQVDSDKKYVMRVIKEYDDWVEKKDITRRTQKLKKKDREEILQDLTESDIVEKSTLDGAGKRTITVYRAKVH